MENKFIIFWVFGSIVLGLFVPTMSTSDGLSVDQANFLDEIISNHDSAISAYSRAVKLVFQVINEFVSESIYQLEIGTDDAAFKLDEALGTAKNASTQSLRSVSLVLGNPCPAVQIAKIDAYAYLNDAFAQTAIALNFARAGGYSDRPDAIEARRVAVRDDLTKVVSGFFGTIITCRNITDAQTLAVIDNANKTSLIGFVHLTNAVFNAITTYAASAANCDSYSFLSEIVITSTINDLRSKALTGLREGLEHQSAILKTIYIVSSLDQPQIVTGLATNQFLLTAALGKTIVANGVVFDAVRYFLRRIALGFGEDGDNDFSRINRTSAHVGNIYHTVDKLTVDSIVAIQSIPPAKVAATRDTFYARRNLGVKYFFDILFTAAAQGVEYSETIELLKTYMKLSLSRGHEYTKLIFELIRSNYTWSDEVEAKFATLQDRASSEIQVVTRSLYGALKILTTVTNAGYVSEDQFEAIKTLKAQANVANANYMQHISSASLIVLVTNT